MGGQSSQTTNSTQNQSGTTSLLQNQNRDTITGQSSSTGPWDAAMPTVQGILGQLNPLINNSGINSTQQAGINGIIANANNPYAGSIGNYATDLLGGGGATAQSGNVSSNLDQLRSRLSPTANGSMIGQNSGLQPYLDTLAGDITSQVNGSFASAGRDFSGANSQALGRGIAQGLSPVIAQQYNTDTGNMMNAANQLYGAGNSTAGILSALNQQGLQNRGQGVSAADAALNARNYGNNELLRAGGLQSSIPTQNLGLLAQIGIPIAGLGQNSSGTQAQSSMGTNQSQGASSQYGTGTSTTQNNPSLLSQLQGWTNLLGAWV